MIKIMICDDNPAFAGKMSRLVEKFFMSNDLDYRIDSATDPARVTDGDISGHDLFLLDVEMGAENGIDLGKKIRGQNPGATIIYISAYHHYAISGYKVKAFDYILKSDPNFEPSLFDSLGEALEANFSAGNKVRVRFDRGYVDMPLRDITYVESRGRKVLFHTADGRIYETYSRLSDVAEELSGKGFCQIHKSYIVNLRRVRKISGYVAYLSDGATLKTTANTDRYTEILRAFALSRGKI